MDYVATLQWLYAQLPMYQRVGPAALNLNLDKIATLVSHLDNPQKKFKSIHVAGTNGKGSSSHMLAAILQKAGYAVGLYTSPHLKDFRERIRINGTPIAEDFVVRFVAENKAFFEAEAFSFFEMTVALAFDYFASQQVDVAVIEVGLGGRLDATNVISPEACLITNISLDHQQFLGTTRAEIAAEKAGIIKTKTPVVVVEHDAETLPVFKAIAQEKNAPLHIASPYDFKTDLLGDYQKQNINGVASLLQVLPQFSISEEAITNGFQNVVSNTGLRGRWEIIGNHPKIIADVAHNSAGLKAVIAQLESEHFKALHVVFGVAADKNLDAILTLLPKKAHYYLCAADVPRAMPIADLATEFKKAYFDFSTYFSVKNALAAAKKRAVKEDLIFVGGSLFVVSEILP
ncbi:MAG: bifunctional folylpolyglutamate synthase/dihydrofolate synthase [Bacteroidetes bacterium]|nr:bifunctional folylpolyglutamate synthase/dihydrofolate synthase [Bacteroidota bacterium]MDA0889239.1 bifunctional folylpolyglutamate synthase/dihydrofolate synthase [Bacteroidota bacterium]MDA1085097.1 bifunctional folylpolyglutamate synthase/dihydrofolate synthase [Bacteroidota bacterium]